MGFFSWLTADTEESIANVYSSRPTNTVYLLQPNYDAPIAEPAYEGYGKFGGVDAHVWLARQNLPAEALAGLDEEQVRSLGISLDCGNYYLDAQTGEKVSVWSDVSAIDPAIRQISKHYDEPLAEYDGQTANDLVASGRLVRRRFEVKRPLKFSFDPDADYNALPASKRCPQQGYFYSVNDDDFYDDDLDEAA